MQRPLRALMGALLFLQAAALGTALHAQETRYSLELRGISIGDFVLVSRVDGQSYGLAGRVRSTGVVGALRPFRYDGQASGRVSGAALQPTRYTAQTDTGRRQSQVELAYQGGTPRVVSYSSPRPAGPDSPEASTQGGTIDPLTAGYTILRDVPPGQACRAEVTIFDGRRRSTITLRPAGQEAGLPVCSGRYTRRQGFRDDEVARHQAFDFTLRYQQGANGQLQVREVVFQSTYGPAAIRRR